LSALFKELGGRKADVVLSDMSPDISGNYSIDHARSIELLRNGSGFCPQGPAPGGNFVVKVFMGDLFGTFMAAVKRNFRNVHAYHPEASRPSSSEIYVVAKGFGMEWCGDRLTGKGRVKGDDRVQGSGVRGQGHDRVQGSGFRGQGHDGGQGSGVRVQGRRNGAKTARKRNRPAATLNPEPWIRP